MIFAQLLLSLVETQNITSTSNITATPFVPIPCNYPPTLKLSHPHFFGIAVNNLLVNIDISITSYCDGALLTSVQASCSLTINDPTISVQNQGMLQISIPPQTTLGIYTGSVTCSQDGPSSTLNFNFKIVNPQTLTRIKQQEVPDIPDCTNTIITTKFVDIISNGGVEDYMIQILPFHSKEGDILSVASSLEPEFAISGAFSLQAVKNGFVSVKPVQLQSVTSSRTASIPIQISDPAGNVITSDVKVNIVHTYCPAISTSIQQPILSNGMSAPVISSDNIPLFETHGLSIWDFEWNVPVVTNGVLEFYCPDNECMATQDVHWYPIHPSITKIKHVIIKHKI